MKTRLTAAALLLCGLLILLIPPAGATPAPPPAETAPAAAHPARQVSTGTTTLVSVNDDGEAADDSQGHHATGGTHVGAPDLAADGRSVAFGSGADNLVPGDTNEEEDVFVRDVAASQTSRVSVSSGGTQGNDWSPSYYNNVSISANGRFVAFDSRASNLVADGVWGSTYVHDRQTGQTTLVSVASDGTPANAGSPTRPGSVSISADGRFVAFASEASNLVDNDTNFSSDVFVHDRQTGQTSRVSVTTDGTQADGRSIMPVISANGRFVAFVSDALNLVDNDTWFNYDVFVHDRQTGQTSLVSGNSGSSGEMDGEKNISISANGRFVAFASNASDLVDNDTNGYVDVFVHDRLNQETTRVSVASDGSEMPYRGYYVPRDYANQPSISADGRFVAFQTDSPHFWQGYRDGYYDYSGEYILIHDRQTKQTTTVSVTPDGTPAGRSYHPSISANGRFVAFAGRINLIHEGESSDFCTHSGSDYYYNCWQIFLHDRGNSGYSITGRVTNNAGEPLAGVIVWADTGSFGMTDAEGLYTLDNLAAGSYTLTAQQGDTVFSPAAPTVTLPPNVANQDFSGVPPVEILNLADVPNGSLYPDEGNSTVDGNQLMSTIQLNPQSGELFDGKLKLVDVTTSPEKVLLTRTVYESSPTALKNFFISLAGMSRNASGELTPQRTLVARLELDSGQTLTSEPVTLKIRPRPVVLIHGLKDTAAGWAAYAGEDGFLASIGIDYCLEDVKDCAVDTLDTGSNEHQENAVAFTIDENAQELSEYIEKTKEKFGAEQVDLVAHSLGGLIARRYIAHHMPTPDVNQLIMLGTPNAGSVTAGVAKLGSFTFRPGGLLMFAILGRAYQPISELTPYYLAKWNEQNYETRDVPFYAVAGNLGNSAISGCLLYGNPLEPNPDDIIVARKSVFAIPLDGGWTFPDLSNGGCSGDHRKMRDGSGDAGPEIFNNYVKPLLQGQMPTLPPDHTNSVDVQSVQDDTTATQYSEVQPGTLQPGDTLEFSWVPESDEEATFITVGRPSQMTVTLRDPTGHLITPDTTDPPIEYMALDENLLPLIAYRIPNPTPGAWTVSIEPNEQTPAEGLPVATLMSMQSDLRLTALPVTETAQVNQPLSIRAQVQADTTPILGATVETNLLLPDSTTMTLTLRDDGSNGDETAADGIYSHVFTPTLPGPYGGTIAASGTHADQPFSRSAVWAAPVEDETRVYLPLIVR